ncbi:hypothetical protein CR970_02995 [Candidatus Saccharibacteria bacterium]|nr:MAG: hypothetical protein CR970_02995 [Candidatus Saccharibacteria bacterium]
MYQIARPIVNPLLVANIVMPTLHAGRSAVIDRGDSPDRSAAAREIRPALAVVAALAASWG